VWPRGLSFGTFPIFRGRSSSGQSVTVDSSLGLVPVFSAVSLLAGAVGSLPLKVYRDPASGDQRTESKGSRQWALLHDAPNDEMAADEFWELVTSSLLLWGNAFIWKQRDELDRLKALWPINPARVQVGRRVLEGKTVREFWLDGARDPVYEVDILQIRGLGSDGLIGLSPIQQARQRLGIEMAREEFSGSFWKNGTFAGAVLEHPNHLSKPAQDRLQQQVREKSGTLKAGEAMILEEGMVWKTLGMPLEDAQFVQQANLGRLEVALLFLIPPYKLGAETEKSMTYSNAEWESLDFVKWSLRRWLVRIENSLKRDATVFPQAGPKLFPEFLVDALLRADTKARYEAYSIGFGKWLNAEWIQEKENITLPEGTEIVEPKAPVVQLQQQQPSSNGVPPQPVAAE
jgi:HK97 family phage portal protein